MSFPPSAQPLPDVQRVLCVYAHPDDIDFGCAGTVARFVDEGIEVAYLVVTRGDAGGFDETPRERMPVLREAEQRAAAQAVGVKQVDFLDGYSDGRLSPTFDLRRDITAAIRRWRPERILTSSPLRRWELIAGPSHPDHLAVGEATTCAVYPDARNPFAYPELSDLPAWTVREIWYSGGPGPDHLVDVTDTYPRKLAALRAHVTQTAHVDDLDETLRARMRGMAERAGLDGGRLAEGYTIIRTG